LRHGYDMLGEGGRKKLFSTKKRKKRETTRINRGVDLAGYRPVPARRAAKKKIAIRGKIGMDEKD